MVNYTRPAPARATAFRPRGDAHVPARGVHEAVDAEGDEGEDEEEDDDDDGDDVVLFYHGGGCLARRLARSNGPRRWEE